MDLYLPIDGCNDNLDIIREHLQLLGYKQSYVCTPYQHFSPVYKCVGFEKGTSMIQIIIVLHGPSAVPAILEFDFSYLSNWYRVRRSSGQARIYISDLKALLTRTAAYGHKYVTSLNYIIKFMNFNIATNLDEPIPFLKKQNNSTVKQMEKFIQRCFLREIKYRERGFNLETSSMTILHEAHG